MPAPRKATGLGRGLGELFQRTAPLSQEEREALQAGAAGMPGHPSLTREDERSWPAGADPSAGLPGEGERSRGDVALAPMPENSYLADLPVTSITPNPAQPRTVFDPEQITELAESIKEVGLLQPIVVRPLGGDRYELVMGERRLRATEEAGLATISAIVRPTEEEDLLRDALLENLHRVQLNPLEEAAAYQQLLRDFGCTQDELAARIKRSRPQIANTIRLLRLPPTVQRRVASGVLTAGHARALLSLDDPAAMERLAQRIVAEGLSVRATEEIVAVPPAEDATKQHRRPLRAPNPRAVTTAEELSDYLDTRVRVALGRTHGRITVEFAGEDDLDRILRLMMPSTVS